MGKYDDLFVTTGDTISAEKWNELVTKLKEHELKIQGFMAEGPLRIETERPEGGDSIKYKVVIANDALQEGDEGGAKVESSLNFGADTRQMINLWKEEYGIGIQANTVYTRSGHGFAWFAGGRHHHDMYNAGEGGRLLMVLNNGGLAIPGGELAIAHNGGVLDLEGKDHVYMEFFPRSRAEGRKAWMGFGAPGAKDLFIANDDEGNITLAGKNGIDLRPGNNKKLRINGQAPIIFRSYEFSTADKSAILHNTGIHTSSYNAAIVGFSTGEADIDEGGRVATFMKLRMVSKGAGGFRPVSVWHIDADLKTHSGKHAKWTVEVMFIRKELCE